MQPLEDVLLELERGAGLVGVLEPKHEGAAGLAREEVVEQRRPSRADVQRAGGAGRDAAPRGHRGGLLLFLFGRDLARLGAGHDLGATVAPHAARGKVVGAAAEVPPAPPTTRRRHWSGRRHRSHWARHRPERRPRWSAAGAGTVARPEVLPPGHVLGGPGPRPRASDARRAPADARRAGAAYRIGVAAARPPAGDRPARHAPVPARGAGPTRGDAADRTAAGRPPARPGSAPRRRCCRRGGSAWPGAGGQP